MQKRVGVEHSVSSSEDLSEQSNNHGNTAEHYQDLNGIDEWSGNVSIQPVVQSQAALSVPSTNPRFKSTVYSKQLVRLQAATTTPHSEKKGAVMSDENFEDKLHTGSKDDNPLGVVTDKDGKPDPMCDFNRVLDR